MGLDLSRLGKKSLPPLIGRVAIGEKNEKGFPSKIDHFIFTHPFDPKTKVAMVDKVATEAMEKKFGPRPKRIRVTLIFDHPDEVFYTSLTNYCSKGWTCKSEDGCIARRKDSQGRIGEVECDFKTCEFKIDGKGNETCKPTGILTFLLLDVPKVGGVWRFSTRGYHTICALKESLEFLYTARKSLRGLEVELVYSMVQMEIPDPRGTGTVKQNVPIIKAELPFTHNELACGSGTVYGDWAEIQAGIAKGIVPNKTILKELGTTADQEYAGMGESMDTDSPEVTDAEVVDEEKKEESTEVSQHSNRRRSRSAGDDDIIF